MQALPQACGSLVHACLKFSCSCSSRKGNSTTRHRHVKVVHRITSMARNVMSVRYAPLVRDFFNPKATVAPADQKLRRGGVLQQYHDPSGTELVVCCRNQTQAPDQYKQPSVGRQGGGQGSSRLGSAVHH